MNSLIMETLQISWFLAPLPFLLIYLFVLGAVLLFAEFQVTRLFRLTWGWKKAPPILPQISLGVAWIMRLSRTLLWLWLWFFLAVTLVLLGDRLINGYQSQIGAIALTAAQTYHDGYQFMRDLIPAFLLRLLPGV